MTFRNGGWVLLLGALVAVATVLAFWPRGPRTHSALPGDGHSLVSYGFDWSRSTIDTALVAPAGIPRDGIPSLEFPSLLTPAEADDKGAGGARGRGKYLVSKDRVIGVERNGVSRAYPLRILVWHEVVNDTLGGDPVCVTYNPISDGALVFDRRLSGDATTFGHSGLLYNHSLLLYDRAPAVPSVFSQLLARGVAGPHAGEALTPVPFRVTHWGAWRDRHPDTTVLDPDPRMARQYRREPYVNYFGNDRLRDLPLHPLPPPGGLANKARVLTLWRGEEAVTVPFSLLRAHADASGTWRTEVLGTSVTFRVLSDPDVAMVESSAAPVVAIPSFWFARHAVNPSISQLDAGF